MKDELERDEEDAYLWLRQACAANAERPSVGNGREIDLAHVAYRAAIERRVEAASRARIETLRQSVRNACALATGLAIRCELLESARDDRISVVETADLAAHAHDTSAAIYAALDRLLVETNGSALSPAAPEAVSAPKETHDADR